MGTEFGSSLDDRRSSALPPRTVKPCSPNDMPKAPKRTGHYPRSGSSFLTICHYLLELMRITREGGFVVFDVPTKSCMFTQTVQNWAGSDIDGGP